MSSKTEICNLALSHVGVGKEIGNVDTESSASASACRRFYDSSRNETFRDFNWSFATRYITLGLVEETPNTEWLYSYRYPSDCFRIRKILSSVRNDTRQTRIPYMIASDSVGKLIYTDQDDAVIRQTTVIVDVALYTQDYIMMLSLLLASYIAPRVTGGDPFGLGKRAFELYVMSKTKAEATNFNEQQDEETVDSEFIRSRE